MLKCIAIDDEPLALRQLQGYIAKINFLKLEKAFTNAIEAHLRRNAWPRCATICVSAQRR